MNCRIQLPIYLELHELIWKSRVSIVGPPLASCTRTAISVAKRLGLPPFDVGEELRTKAKSDPDLQRQLDEGDLTAVSST